MKTSQETSQAVDTPIMRKPRTGKGLLRTGNPGNVGGSGAPPSELRARLRGSLSERIAIVNEIADDPTSSAADRLRAVDLLAKYGIGQIREVSTEDVAGRLRETITLIRRQLPARDAEDLINQMGEIWRR